MSNKKQAEGKFSESWVAQNIIKPIPFIRAAVQPSCQKATDAFLNDSFMFSGGMAFMMLNVFKLGAHPKFIVKVSGMGGAMILGMAVGMIFYNLLTSLCGNSQKAKQRDYVSMSLS